MRKTRSLSVAALAALTITAPLAPAHAAGGPPVATSPCTVVTTSPSTVSPGNEIAVFTGYAAAPGATAVSIRCSLHADNNTHDGAAVTEATGGPTPNAAAIPVAVTTHPYDPYAIEYLCGEATVDGTTWYWTGTAWTTDAGSVCGVLVELGDCLGYLSCVPWNLVPWEDVPPALQPVVRAIGCWLAGWEFCWDYLVCDYLAALSPGLPGGVVDIRPDGDVYIAGEAIWDCPPYQVW
jgi:hypothetical protein